CPAIPTTRVAKIRGAISDLIIRRKMVESGLSCCELSGNAQPTSVPITMAMMIHCVSDRLRRKVNMEFVTTEAQRAQRAQRRRLDCLLCALCASVVNLL